LFPRHDSFRLLKTFWFFMVSVLLGPFALWFSLLGKRRRRGLSPDYLYRLLILVFGFLVAGLPLFFAPLHWSVLTALYLGSAGVTGWAMGRPERAQFFRVGLQSASAEAREAAPWQTLLAAGLAIYPLIYILALLHNIGELESFSIHLPSDVYTDGLLWMIYATPGVALAGYAAWKAAVKPGLRVLIFFYASVLVVLAWIMVWEKVDQMLLAQFYGSDREPLLFAFSAEAHFRSVVKWFFYASAFLLGSGYLIGAARTSVFAKRAFFLGVPSFLLYANMLFLLGDWNYFLSALRQKLLESHDYGLYRLAAGAQLARVPSAYRAPYVLDELAEVEYQSGRRERAKALLAELARRCGDRPYYARLRKRAQASLARLASPPAAGAKELMLELPVIKPASYLDTDWYALLSAIAFLEPKWTDLELRKRLLDLSSTVQLHLPKMDNIPELGPGLRQLGIGYSACFLTADRIKRALAADKVPFVSLYSHWVPVSGYDPGRDGFYYYSYRAHEASPDWFRNEDIDLFYHKAGDTFGGQREKSRTRDFKYSLQKFIPSKDLEDHIVDIGGVGLILGDSAFAPEAEQQAAFLVEQGDIDYQDHDDYVQAAAAYKRAAGLFPVDQVLSRMLYLKRRHSEFAGDARDYRNLFRDYPPAWMKDFGPEGAKERALVGKILAGDLGTYLLMNWYVPPPPDTAPQLRPAMDTALRIFARLHEMEPEEPLYLDTLATLHWRIGDLAGSEKLYAEMAGLYPFGNEYAMFQLAWVKFKLGKTRELPAILARCKGFSSDAKYLTMQGAEALSRGKYRKAHTLLAKSLKLDKGIEETHSLLADYYRRKGDNAAADVHLRWLRRST
jgi:hypothetical protein